MEKKVKKKVSKNKRLTSQLSFIIDAISPFGTGENNLTLKSKREEVAFIEGILFGLDQFYAVSDSGSFSEDMLEFVSKLLSQSNTTGTH